MNDKDFLKRYDKLKKNNLPMAFYDEERNTLEYVYYTKNNIEHLEVGTSLTDVLGDICYTGFYYPFTSRYFSGKANNMKSVVGHNHAHSFEEVVSWLYYSPESFSISKDLEEYYSTQELEYLRRVQKYLLFIGLKDVKSRKTPKKRYRNELQAKYDGAVIQSFSDKSISDFMSLKRNYIVRHYSKYSENSLNHQYKVLIVDKENYFKLFILVTHNEVKTYEDIKSVYKSDDLNDNDTVELRYFKILEKY